MRAPKWTLAVLAMILVAGLATRTTAATPMPAAVGAPAGLRLDVSLAQGRATVGDRIEVLLTLRVPTAQLAGEPRFPAWGQSWGEAEVVEKGAPARISETGGTAVYRQRIVVTAWQPGRVALPRVAAAVPLRGATVQAESPGNLALTLASVLPVKKEGEKDPAPKPAAPPSPCRSGRRSAGAPWPWRPPAGGSAISSGGGAGRGWRPQWSRRSRRSTSFWPGSTGSPGSPRSASTPA